METKAELLLARFWQWRISNFPEFATMIGEHRHDDCLNDLSLEGIERKYVEASNLLREVNELLEQYHLQESPCDELKLLASDLHTYVTGLNSKAYLCPVNRFEGPQFDFYYLLNQMKKGNKMDYDMIIARLSVFPKQIEQVIELLKEGIRQKVTLNEHSISPVPKQIKNIVSKQFSESSFMKFFQEKPRNISSEDWEILIENAKNLVNGCVFPALLTLSVFLSKQYMNYTRSEVSACSLPRGRAFYESCLRYHTSTRMTPAEIHALGLKEVKRISQRMLDVKDEMKFEGSLNEFKDYLNDSNMCYVDEKELLENYSVICERIWKELPKMFNTLPKERCIIKPVPKEQEQTFPSAFYKEGNGNRPGIFLINTYHPKTRAKWKSLALALHEAIPGHHLHSDHFLRNKSIAKFRKFIEGGGYHVIPGRFPLHTALMEGWGLYAEYLGEEMNLFHNLYDLFGRLVNEMLRASRLVVDTGLHAFNWTRQQAIDYIIDTVGFTTANSTSEVDRYITWPAQACSYKIGELKLHELRRIAEKSLGENFDIREFHNVLLSVGAAPLDFLEEKMQKYINTKLATPISLRN